MDRDRLKNIQTADLSESNVNEDFVFWLKTKGPSYLLIIMIVIVVYVFFVRYQQGQTSHRAEAWIEFLEANASGLPASLIDIAESYSDIDTIEGLGLLSAADAYLQAVIAGRTVGSDVNITTSLTLEDRTFYLEKADNLFGRIVASDDSSIAAGLLVVSGLNGRAAVAEADGRIDAAKSFYEAVIARVGSSYPALASQAQLRIDSLDTLAEVAILPTDAAVAARSNQSLQRDPTTTNSSIDALIDLDDTNGDQ